MDVYMQFLDSQMDQFAIEDIEMSPNTNINDNHNMILEQLNNRNQPNLTVPNPSANPSSLQNNEQKNKQENDQNQNNMQVEQTSIQNSMNNNDYESNNNINEVTNPEEYEIKKDDDPEKLNFYPELPKVMVNSSYRTYQYDENPETEFNERELNDANNFNYRNYTEVTKENTKDKI